jgi:hypothetical protein
MTGAYVPPQMSEPIYDEPMVDETPNQEQEEKPKVTIIDEGGKKGKRGRPKKK